MTAKLTRLTWMLIGGVTLLSAILGRISFEAGMLLLLYGILTVLAVNGGER